MTVSSYTLVENDGKLYYYRINRKTGRIETNLLEWKRSWKNVKILTYPTRFANELRLGPDPGGQRDAT